MKAYKATHDFKCRNQLYEVGKTYASDKMRMCEYGIHFCNKMEDTLNYYDYDPKTFVLLEVEVIGETDYGNAKGVTNKLKVLRVVPKEEYDGEFLGKIPACEYDERNNMISMTCPGGGKYTCEYDERNNRISKTYPDGGKYTFEYDGRNNIISETYPNGGKHTFEYDGRNNLISKTCPGGGKYTYEYDERNNRISKTCPGGGKYTFEYDERNNRISETSPRGYKTTYGHAVITCD